MPTRAPTPTDARDAVAVSAPAAKAKSGPLRAMEKLGLRRDIDLALHIPLRYEDETRLTPIAELHDGISAQVEGVVQRCEIQQRNRRQLLVTLVDDAGETLLLRFLHFYPSHQKTLAEGRRVRARGEARGGFFGLEMVHPTFKAVDGDSPLATALTAVYPTSASLPQAYLRRAVTSALQRADLSETVPAELLPRGLATLRDALQWLHHPPADVSLAALDDRSHPAWQRLKFEELLAQQLSQLQAKRERAKQRAPRFTVSAGGLHERLLAALPFALTGAQRRVVEEIADDLQRAHGDGQLHAQAVPMHRLLQGDVGSGKTVVAALAAAIAIHNGWQCALMAPTEILADQHFRKLVGWLEPLGITTAWLTGSRKGRGRREMLERVASGEAGLVVGTHAVIQDDVQFARLGLAVVDEQHRFGVAQRLALRSKLEQVAQDTDPPRPGGLTSPGSERRSRWPEGTLTPHLLMMSATPIPRTLAMTMYADLDISTIDELPPGRTPIVTKVFADAKRDAVVARIRDEVAQGKQVYWVCPLIEEAAEGDPPAPIEDAVRPSKRPFGERPELQNVIDTHQMLTDALPGVGVGLLHGRMKAADKAATMAKFTAGELSVLVATTVIEVGVDVPNASLMVIEHAERFGLSQLHQLRGRVGRGSVASVCVLMYAAPLSLTGKARLKAMAETTDGFEIARRDLEIRGPGEFLGARQSGAALLRFADLNDDLHLLHAARAAADAMLERHQDAARRHVVRWLGSRADYLKA